MAINGTKLIEILKSVLHHLVKWHSQEYNSLCMANGNAKLTGQHTDTD